MRIGYATAKTPTSHQKGSLEIICGSMFSGKTEELMRRLKRAEYAKLRVLTIKHHIDNRKHYSCVGSITSHDGRERVAFPIGGTPAGIKKIIELAHKDVDVVGIDEIHFFPPEIVDIIFTLIDEGKRVIISGLELDFRGEPFSVMPELLCFADRVVKLRAVCSVCGADAHHSQRLVDGKPARYDDPLIMVGAEEYYQARCRNCFIIDKPLPSGTSQAVAEAPSTKQPSEQKKSSQTVQFI